MNAWWTLLQKEYRMIRTSVLVKLTALVIIGFWLVYLFQHRHPNIIAAPAALLAIGALFFPAIFMFKYINRELIQTPHLWLHCPQPSWLLLAAKLVMGLIYMIILLLLAAIFIYWSLLSGYSPEQTGIDTKSMTMMITEAGTYAALAIIAISIYLASWATLAAVATAAVRNILGRYYKLTAMVIFIAATWGMGRLHESFFFVKLTHWGPLQVSLLSVRGFFPGHNPFVAQIYSGQILFYFLLTAALFALSAWLIDHKVEV